MFYLWGNRGLFHAGSLLLVININLAETQAAISGRISPVRLISNRKSRLPFPAGGMLLRTEKSGGSSATPDLLIGDWMRVCVG